MYLFRDLNDGKRGLHLQTEAITKAQVRTDLGGCRRPGGVSVVRPKGNRGYQWEIRSHPQSSGLGSPGRRAWTSARSDCSHQGVPAGQKRGRLGTWRKGRIGWSLSMPSVPPLQDSPKSTSFVQALPMSGRKEKAGGAREALRCGPCLVSQETPCSCRGPQAPQAGSEGCTVQNKGLSWWAVLHRGVDQLGVRMKRSGGRTDTNWNQKRQGTKGRRDPPESREPQRQMTRHRTERLWRQPGCRQFLPGGE